MGTVLEDVTSETVDAARIQRRVEDWEERLNGLYAAIGDCCRTDGRPGRALWSSCTSR